VADLVDIAIPSKAKAAAEELGLEVHHTLSSLRNDFFSSIKKRGRSDARHMGFFAGTYRTSDLCR
jgi:hypothetical protein